MADKPPRTGNSAASTTFDESKRSQSSMAFPISSSSSSDFPSSSPLTSFLPTTSSNPTKSMSMASNSRPTVQSSASMAPPASEDGKKFDISTLMSPPDPILDSFNSSSHRYSTMGPPSTAAIVPGRRATDQQPLPMSPPVSPYSKPIPTATNTPTTPPSHAIKDPVLYPADEGSPSSPSQAPLFAPAEIESHQRIVEDHVRARPQSIFTGVAPPRKEDYELALTFRSQVMKHYTSNRKAWLRKERALLQADRRAGAQRYHSILPAKPIVAKPARPSHRPDRVSKPQNAPRPLRTSISIGTTPPTGPMRPAARTSATPEPSRRIVAPNREDKDFNSLPNYSPPLDSLPNRSNSLKVDWKGQPIDLSGDPFEHLLHPDEMALAGNLRLDCATYLTSKRRIFERRLQCLRSGKEFRKTDAQQACKIDVNKASKLWTAFDKVGWLDARWVRRFL